MKLVVKEGKKNQENLEHGKVIFVVEKFDHSNEDELDLLNLLNESMKQAKAPAFFDVMDDDKIAKQNFHQYIETGDEINKGSLLNFSLKYLSCYLDLDDYDFEKVSFKTVKDWIRAIMKNKTECAAPARMGIKR